MNKMQWHSWGAIFLVLALTLMMVHISIVRASSDGFVWAVGRFYFLAIWFAFGIAFGCISSAYYSDMKSGAMSIMAPMKSRSRRRSRPAAAKVMAAKKR